MKVIQNISLDFGRSTFPVTVFAKQYDKESRYINITPFNCGLSYELESGITARLQLTKPDGHTVVNDCSIAENTITVELTEQCLTVAGKATAEIRLYKGTSVLSSHIFYIDVKKAAYDSSAPESNDEYNALINLIETVENKLENGDFKGETGAKGDPAPVYILEWHDGTDLSGVVHPTDAEKQANVEVIQEIREKELGAYLLYLKVGGRLLPACSIMNGTYSFIDSSSSDGTFPVYSISYSEGTLPSGEVKKTYSQDSGNHVESDFDESSYAAPSMIAVADFVEQKLSAALNIDSEALI